MPLGPVGVRTALLFIPTMIVYILRVAQMHVGQRSTISPVSTFMTYCTRLDTPRTFMAYTVSAWVFSEIYIWSRSSSDRLDYTDPGKLHERIRLNERPIFLRSMFVILGSAQAFLHLCRDYDRIRVPATASTRSQVSSKPTTRPSPNSQILDKLLDIIKESTILALVVVGVGPIIYFTFMRNLLWSWHYSFAKYLVSLPKSTKPAGLVGVVDLLGKFIVEGSYLATLWGLSNTTFNIYMSQEPLKKDKPITDDSKDPNGSLLNGLKSKREVAKNIAFWELALITERFSHRRQRIFQEDDRRNGATWKQVVEVCLGEIRDIKSRIDAQRSPGSQTRSGAEKKPEEPIQLVPRISSPIKEDKIMGPGVPPENRLQKFEAFASDFAKVHSSPENARNARAKKLLDSGTKGLNQGVQTSRGFLDQYSSQFFQSPLGTFFQSSTRRTASVVIGGTPYSRVTLVVNAIKSLTKLAVLSLKEDSLGQFHKEVPEIIRVFSTAIKQTEEYLRTLSLFVEENSPNIPPDVADVVSTLRDGLENVLGAFAEYLEHMSISPIDLRDAKELVSGVKARRI
jgi:nucleoporin NDC1